MTTTGFARVRSNRQATSESTSEDVLMASAADRTTGSVAQHAQAAPAFAVAAAPVNRRMSACAVYRQPEAQTS
jgi:hypothetical protein